MQTHNLCYLYGRATQAISVCAPAHYAHLACERGKVYLHKDYHYPDPSVKNPEWIKANAAWTKTKHEGVGDNGQLVPADKLAETMYYV